MEKAKQVAFNYTLRFVYAPEWNEQDVGQADVIVSFMLCVSMPQCLYLLWYRLQVSNKYLVSLLLHVQYLITSKDNLCSLVSKNTP